jgi:hypothetical protein
MAAAIYGYRPVAAVRFFSPVNHPGTAWLQSTNKTKPESHKTLKVISLGAPEIVLEMSARI